MIFNNQPASFRFFFPLRHIAFLCADGNEADNAFFQSFCALKFIKIVAAGFILTGGNNFADSILAEFAADGGQDFVWDSNKVGYL
ncbi:hypothetical protein Q4R35_13940 [Morganella morganii]